jgi:hypothetical protein
VKPTDSQEKIPVALHVQLEADGRFCFGMVDPENRERMVFAFYSPEQAKVLAEFILDRASLHTLRN